MGIKKQDGFTIIEISLFFAVSGLLLMTMLTGIGLAVQRQRFSDAVNSTQSFLQQQYNETQITLNDRDNTNDCGSSVDPKGTSNCLVIGKIVDLGLENPGAEESTIISYRVIVNQAGADDAAIAVPPLTDLAMLNDPSLNTRAIKDSNNDSSFTLPWGAKLSSIRDSAGSETLLGSGPVRYILLLRSPINGLISTYKLSSSAELFNPSETSKSLTTGGNAIVPFSPSTNPPASPSVKACINSGDVSNAKALLTIKPNGSQDGVTVGYDADAESWCNAP